MNATILRDVQHDEVLVETSAVEVEVTRFVFKLRSWDLSFKTLFDHLAYVDYAPQFRQQVLDVIYSLSNQADVLPRRREGVQVEFASGVTVRGFYEDWQSESEISPEPTLSPVDQSLQNLRFCAEISAIDLAFTAMSVFSVRTLVEHLDFRHLQTLNLWKCGLNDVGAMHLGRGLLVRAPALEHFILDENCLTGAGATEIFQHLKNPLQLLSLSKNLIGSTALRIFFRSATVLQVVHLVLAEVGCDDEVAALLLRRLKGGLGTLKTLVFRGNGLSDSTLQAFNDLLRPALRADLV
jgi:hypothetical protein